MMIILHTEKNTSKFCSTMAERIRKKIRKRMKPCIWQVRRLIELVSLMSFLIPFPINCCCFILCMNIASSSSCSISHLIHWMAYNEQFFVSIHVLCWLFLSQSFFCVLLHVFFNAFRFCYLWLVCLTMWLLGNEKRVF